MSRLTRLSFLVLSVALFLVILNVIGAAAAATAAESDSEFEEQESSHSRRRWKREDDDDSTWKVPGSGVLRKAKKLLSSYKNLPDNLRTAIESGDFSKVTRDDINGVNVTVLEYIPTSAFEKANVTLLSAFLDKFLFNNKPNAMARLIDAAGPKLDTDFLLDKLKAVGNNNDAANVILYNAVNKLGDKGISDGVVNRLVQDDLLKSVPEEQLMRVKDSVAATNLLTAISHFRKKEDNDIDDQALVAKLAEVAFGSAKNWTANTLPYTAAMPGAFLKDLSPQLVTDHVEPLSKSANTPFQAKAIAEVYLEKNQVHKNQAGFASLGNLTALTGKIGKLTAFLPTSLTKEPNILERIMEGCDTLNLPAPIKSVFGYFEAKLRAGSGQSGNRKIADLGFGEFGSMTPAILKNSPPQVIQAGVNGEMIDENNLIEIGKSASVAETGGKQGSLLKGLLAQLSKYAVQHFGGSSGRIDFANLPGAFLGALGINNINGLDNRNDRDKVRLNVKDNPDALDDVQKTVLVKKIRDGGNVRVNDLPGELKILYPRKKGDMVDPNFLDDLPSDAELRFAFGEGKKVSALELKNNPELIGTLTKKQIDAIDLEQIPTVLALVRKSRDGPQAQALKALQVRFVEYIRLKSDDYETENDKKLLRHLSAAEVSKLPATVLQYFIDRKQTAKLPPAVRKEILIAMGELSTKDHALIPGKTREEIIFQGLDALESTLAAADKYGAPELAVIAHGVVDLPASKIERLSPASLEQSLDVIQGTADDDDDKLKQRACLNADQRRAWRNQIVQNYGEPDTWAPTTVATLCCSLQLLTEDDLFKISKDAISNCKCASDLEPPSHLAERKKALQASCRYELGDEEYKSAKATFDKVKSQRALEIEDLESQIIIDGRRRKRRSHHDGYLNCYALRLTGSAAPFDTATLESLSPTEMKSCLYELGVDKLSAENEKLLWKKLVEAYDGAVEKITPESLRLANHILGGISESEITKLNFTDKDVVISFGRPLGLHKNVLKKMAAHLAERINYPVHLYQPLDLITAQNILCGLDIESIMKFKSPVFQEALPILRSLEPTCEQTRLAALVNIASTPEVYGPPSNWDAADVRGVGILLKGLTTDAKSIPPEAFQGVTSTVAASLTDTLKELTPEQLSNFPLNAAQTLSEEQKALLSNDARTALGLTTPAHIAEANTASFAVKLSWTLLLTLVLLPVINN